MSIANHHHYIMFLSQEKEKRAVFINKKRKGTFDLSLTYFMGSSKGTKFKFLEKVRG